MQYSICIRTLGKGGEKYSKLLKSIRSLKIKPQEVIIILPRGYNPPNESLGCEKVIYSDKGMLIQRILGFESAKTEYVLLIDDDIEFEPYFINKLLTPIQNGLADITFPIYTNMLPQKGIRSLIPALTLSAVPMLKKDMYIKILPSGGWSYNRIACDYNKPLYTHSAPGTCLFAKRESLINTELNSELWVDVPAYALWEDMVMFYKAWIKGYKIMGVPGIGFEHLDAGASSNNRSIDASYASGLNHVIFWHRFVFKQNKSFKYNYLNIIALFYWIFSSTIYRFINGVFRGKKAEFRAFIKGISEAKKFIRS